MSKFISPPLIPPSINNDSVYNRIEQVSYLTDGISILTEGRLTNLLDPINPLDATNKEYVDAIFSGGGSTGQNMSWKNIVRLATTGTNITLSGLQTIDSVLTNNGDRVLVKDQSDQTQNGIYLANNSNWSRSIDAPLNAIATGIVVIPTNGSINSNKTYICPTTNGTSTVLFGSAITFQLYNQNSAGGSNTQIQYNNSNVLAGSSNLTFDGTNINATGLNTNTIGATNTLFNVNLYTNQDSQITVGSTTNQDQNLVLNGYSGTVSIDKINVSNFGAVNLTGSNSTSVNVKPADVKITAGASQNLANTNAGSVYINAGTSSVNTSGGSIYISAGLGVGGTGSVVITTGNMQIASPTDSTNTTTGALVVYGGLGVAKTLTANQISASTITAGTLSASYISGPFALNANQILIGSNNNISSAVTMSGDGTLTSSGNFALTNVATAGTFSNANISIDAKGRVLSASNGATSSPGGSNSSLQYNNNNTFGGINTWLYSNSVLVGSVSSLFNVMGLSTISSLFSGNSTITNLSATSETVGSLLSTNINSTNNTLTNLISSTGIISALTSTNLYAPTGTITTLLSSNASISNTTISNLLINNSTFTNLLATNETVSILNCSNANITNITNTTLIISGTCSGNIFFGNGYYCYSDERLKNIKRSLTSLESLNKICSLNSLEYSYNYSPHENHFGYIAQDVEKNGLEKLILTDSKDYKLINYVELIPFITESIKELKNSIDEIRSDINDLRNKL